MPRRTIQKRKQMPFIAKDQINWDKINQLKAERDQRLADPTHEASEEMSLPFQGKNYLRYLPWEEMSHEDQSLWTELQNKGAVKESELLRTSG